MGIETLAIVGTALSGLSAVAGFIGSQQQASAAADSARFQAQIARNNETIAEQNAQRAIRVGAEKAQRESLKNRQLVGAAIAAGAASGVDVNSGSRVDVLESQREVGALDVAQTTENAALTAYGYRTQGMNYAAQAQLDEQKADNAEIAGDIGAFGSLLGNAGSLVGKFSSWDKVGGGARTP